MTSLTELPILLIETPNQEFGLTFCVVDPKYKFTYGTRRSWDAVHKGEIRIPLEYYPEYMLIQNLTNIEIINYFVARLGL